MPDIQKGTQKPYNVTDYPNNYMFDDLYRKVYQKAEKKHIHSSISGTFISADVPPKTITIENGIITKIEVI